MQETAMYILQEVKTLLNLQDDNSRDTLLTIYYQFSIW